MAGLTLVTGASGFVASHVIKKLLEEGCTVRGTVRSLENEDKLKHLYELCPGANTRLELVEADLLDAASWEKAVKDCTIIHHVASPLPQHNPENEDEVIKPAVDGTINVLKACLTSESVTRVIITGAGLCVGSATVSNKQPYTEDSWADPQHAMNVYNRSKILSEQAAWQFHKQNGGFELTILHPVGILGPVLHNSLNTSATVIKMLLEREMPMIPRFNMPIVDVRDVALAHFVCMKQPDINGKRFILSAGNLWFKEIAALLDKEYKKQGYNVPTTGMPGWVLRLAAVFNKMARDFKDMEGKLPIFDNTKMITELGITPIDMSVSVMEMASSMINKGLITKPDQHKPAS